MSFATPAADIVQGGDADEDADDEGGDAQPGLNGFKVGHEKGKQGSAATKGTTQHVLHVGGVGFELVDGLARDHAWGVMSMLEVMQQQRGFFPQAMSGHALAGIGFQGAETFFREIVLMQGGADFGEVKGGGWRVIMGGLWDVIEGKEGRGGSCFAVEDAPKQATAEPGENYGRRDEVGGAAGELLEKIGNLILRVMMAEAMGTGAAEQGGVVSSPKLGKVKSWCSC